MAILLTFRSVDEILNKVLIILFSVKHSNGGFGVEIDDDPADKI